jgi:putative flippase GtrA
MTIGIGHASRKEALQEHKVLHVFKTFLRFAGAGLVGTIAHYVLMISMVETLHIAPVAASSSGAVLGGFVNYLFNYHFTFQSSKRHLETLPKFALVACSGFVINGIVVYILVNGSLNYIVAQIIATGVVLAWGFVVNYLWTFVDHPRQSGEEH